jgi:hypothetical protein
VDIMAAIPIMEPVSVSDSLLIIFSDICNSRIKFTPTAIPTRKPIPCYCANFF